MRVSTRARWCSRRAGSMARPVVVLPRAVHGGESSGPALDLVAHRDPGEVVVRVADVRELPVEQRGHGPAVVQEVARPRRRRGTATAARRRRAACGASHARAISPTGVARGGRPGRCDPHPELEVVVVGQSRRARAARDRGGAGRRGSAPGRSTTCDDRVVAEPIARCVAAGVGQQDRVAVVGDGEQGRDRERRLRQRAVDDGLPRQVEGRAGHGTLARLLPQHDGVTSGELDQPRGSRRALSDGTGRLHRRTQLGFDPAASGRIEGGGHAATASSGGRRMRPSWPAASHRPAPAAAIPPNTSTRPAPRSAPVVASTAATVEGWAGDGSRRRADRRELDGPDAARERRRRGGPTVTGAVDRCGRDLRGAEWQSIVARRLEHDSCGGRRREDRGSRLGRRGAGWSHPRGTCRRARRWRPPRRGSRRAGHPGGGRPGPA